ncbi:unnamed protein product [Spodoptera littoralis]|uniref:Uncharacterized protein n=1 Tax=Spodoptera littoralis TaxID=7109 RepID=A0A9P0I6W5_SPOLI|nr:unnamed protein product [Spodoptera littoralis]CAH1642188.1 unnamed protein product [Spodoptera littoralis]
MVDKALAQRDLAEIFENLEREQKTDAPYLIQWIKDSNLVDDSKEDDIQLKIMFKKAKSSRKVRLEEFKAIIMKLAKEKSKTFEELTRQLTEEGPGLMRAATEGTVNQGKYD